MATKRALVCEDDVSIQRLVQTVVQRNGFVVDVASNGAEGMEKLQQGCYELVILDLMMPDVDGYAVVRWLRESRPETLKRVIIMTAATDALRADFPEPVCTLLPKPFDITRLTAVVRECAGGCEAAAS